MANNIYILTNEAMPGMVKIGLTDQSIDERRRQLDTTGVPLPFQVFRVFETEKPMQEVEEALHDAFEDVRVRRNREFFRIAPERVVKLLLLLGKDVTPGHDSIDSPDDQRALEEARARRPVFNFDMVGIPIGAVLTFDYDPNITCRVADRRKVNYNGSITSLNDASLKALATKGYNWQSVQGPAVWLYEGETLLEIRNRLESPED